MNQNYTFYMRHGLMTVLKFHAQISFYKDSNLCFGVLYYIHNAKETLHILYVINLNLKPHLLLAPT